jgi:hypothetical protein
LRRDDLNIRMTIKGDIDDGDVIRVESIHIDQPLYDIMDIRSDHWSMQSHWYQDRSLGPLYYKYYNQM